MKIIGNPYEVNDIAKAFIGFSFSNYAMDTWTAMDKRNEKQMSKDSIIWNRVFC